MQNFGKKGWKTFGQHLIPIINEGRVLARILQGPLRVHFSGPKRLLYITWIVIPSFFVQTSPFQALVNIYSITNLL
ncbi:hypothetical protein DMN77_15430 [Paenibacillus sp. 79R4]|nr:hypothetical protein [Paenibacillus sp. 79R4]